jgi:hypothetical protein
MASGFILANAFRSRYGLFKCHNVDVQSIDRDSVRVPG